MTPWPELLAEGHLLPHFQPIVSTETLGIAAYEALGRLAVGGQVVSLGPFFHPSGEQETQPRLLKEVDRQLRRAAMVAFSAADADCRLFLNIRPSHMLEHLQSGRDELPWTLRTCAEVGLDPRRLVIELTEEAIQADTQRLKVLIDQYRAAGCTIAVDDVGAEASNLDRIGFFEPDIIKIDALMLRRSLHDRSFREVLRGVGRMAEGLGASLLFEGVEAQQDLEQALRYGARFVQGWFFAPAAGEFLRRDAFGVRLRPLLQEFGLGVGARAAQAKVRVRQVAEALASPPRPLREDGAWTFGPGALDRWAAVACRVFLTDQAGFQVSANFEVVDGHWRQNPAALGRSRAMRPYFPGAGDVRWSVSDTYFDVNDRSLIRTFSRPLDEGLLLFVDVPEIEISTLKH